MMPMKNNDDETKILIDADVIRHFIEGGKLNDIVKVFPDRIIMVDIVKNELLRSRRLKPIVESFITTCKIEEVRLEDNFDAMIEYAKLILFADEGEAACMALAKVEKKYIASSNLRDITKYCRDNGIKVYTTMDFLYEGMMNRLFTELECDKFISDVLASGSKLPLTSIAEYVKKYKMPK